MATAIKIALLIQGNVNSSGGMQPLVTVGLFPTEEIGNLDVAPIIQESQSFKIKHCANYIIYNLTDTKVRPIGAARDGRLVIALAMPCRLQLKDGKSPYTLLKEIYTKFVSENMRPTDDGYHIFVSLEPDNEEFRTLLSLNSTEDRPSQVYIPMSQTGGKGVVQAATEEKLEALFRDSQYPEFRQFSEIEIGRTCQPTVNIEIPRHCEYKIMLNGSLINKTLVNGTDSFNSEDYLHDGKYTTYIGQHVAFTLSELITDEDGSMFDGRVTLQGETVKCIVNSKPKEFKFKAEIKPSLGNSLTQEDVEIIKQWLNNNNLRVMFGGENINQTFLNNETIQANGENVNLPLSILTSQSIENYQFSIDKNIETKKIILKARKVRKPDPVPVRYPEPSPRKTQEQNNLPQPAANSTGMELWFINTKDFKNEYRAIVKSSDDKHYLRQTLSFIEKKQKNGETLYRASVTLDDTWKLAGDIIVWIECEKDRIIISSQPQSPSFMNNMAELDITNLQYKKKQSNKPSMIIPIVAGIAGVIFGLVIGWFLFSNISNKENDDNSEDVAELNQKINSLENDIKDKDAEISSLKGQLEAQEEMKTEPKRGETVKTESNPKPVVAETVQVDYKSQIVDKFNTRNYDALSGKNGLLAKAVKAKQITGTQSQKISLFWWNPNDSKGQYNVSQKAKIRDALAGKQFRSIDKIVELSDQLASKLK
jgi:hypothetical protein